MNPLDELSIHSKQRLLCTSNVREAVEVHRDKRARKVRRGRFHTGAFLNRSVYSPHQGKREKARRLRQQGKARR